MSLQPIEVKVCPLCGRQNISKMLDQWTSAGHPYSCPSCGWEGHPNTRIMYGIKNTNM